MNNDLESRLVRLEKLANDQAARIAALQNQAAAQSQELAAVGSQFVQVLTPPAEAPIRADSGKGAAAGGGTGSVTLPTGATIDGVVNQYANTNCPPSVVCYVLPVDNGQGYEYLTFDCPNS